MDTQATKLEDAENDLKRRMDDVSRAMHKAQEAVARITASEMPTTMPKSRAGACCPQKGRERPYFLRRLLSESGHRRLPRLLAAVHRRAVLMAAVDRKGKPRVG